MNTQGSGATRLRQRLGGAGRAVFGNVDWQPPAWGQSLHARVRAQPRRWIGGTVLAVLLLWFGTWWATRPTPVDPDAVAATLTAPVVTDYTKTPPVLSPLTLRFDAPVAPLAAIGKAPTGVRLSPEHPGAWLWSDDRTLVFTPAKDWPIDTEFTIAVDPKRALAPKIRIAQDEHEFTTADFEIAVAGAEFYQDPDTVALKKAVYALTFSHPIDAASLERSLAFNYRDGAGAALAAPAKTVTYDERRLQAWVHSAPLDLPENGGKLQLQIAPGVASTLGGKGSEDEVLSTVDLPSLYSVTVDAVEASIAENDRYEPSRCWC